jgi:hypothetical protein
MAVIVKNAVFSDIKTARSSQQTHYISTTEPSRLMLRNIWGFQGGIMKNAVFWDVTPCSSWRDRRIGGMYRFHHQDEKTRLSTNNLAVTSK